MVTEALEDKLLFSELEAQKSQYLEDQKVKNRLEQSVIEASQVCTECSSRLNEVSHDLDERDQELFASPSNVYLQS